jgi:3-dehydroquinate synthase class II
MQVWCDCRQIICDDIIVKLETMKEEPDFIFATKDSIVPSFPNCKKQLLINSKDSLVINPDNGQTIGVLVNIQNPADQESAMATLGSVQWLIVQCQSTTWQMIPAENLISAAQATGTKLAFCINDPSHVGGLARALELGVDALCVDAAVASKELWDTVFEARQERLLNNVVQTSESYTDANGILFENGYCWRRSVQSTILADRICVDLVQTLLPEEGCWIGSSAKINAFVQTK